MTYEHPKYPKIPRLEKLVWSITEKIDGTNGIVHIVPLSPDPSRMTCMVPYAGSAGAVSVVPLQSTLLGASGDQLAVFAGSRTRWLNPHIKGGDNFGFAAWVLENAAHLVQLLGPGTHYGEWWGQGIQRQYDQFEKRFSLFSPWRYPDIPEAGNPDAGGCIISKVPLLSTGTNTSLLDQAIEHWCEELCHPELGRGSVAAPGFWNPEGLVVTIGNQNHKVIINEGDKSRSRDAG